jgi:hypothetical protein
LNLKREKQMGSGVISYKFLILSFEFLLVKQNRMGLGAVTKVKPH